MLGSGGEIRAGGEVRLRCGRRSLGRGCGPAICRGQSRLAVEVKGDTQ